MITVMVLGGTGMLGHKVFQTLRQRFPDTFCTIRGSLEDPPCRNADLFHHGNVVENVDASDFAALEQVLAKYRPGFIVNCVGVIKQRAEARSAIPSITLNSLLPHRLAEMAMRWDGRVIHFSTDCVFSGERGNYTEADPSDARDLYGQTKYLGEVAAPNALTLRTSIIGRELTHFQSLLEWFLSQEGKTVRGYRQAFWSGVTTNHLAEIVGWLIAEHPDLSGLYQVSSGAINKHDLLVLLREAYGLHVEIVPDDAIFCDRSLNGDLFRRATGYAPPSLPELAARLAADPTPYQEWRKAL